MSMRKAVYLLGSAAVFGAIPLLSAAAQSPSSSPPASPPAATQPAPGPGAKPAPNSVSEIPAASPAKATSLVGLQVISSDGAKLGAVQSVGTQDGKVTAVHIKTGGMLGMGGKLVAIPLANFTRAGDIVKLGITSQEVEKLPELKLRG